MGKIQNKKEKMPEKTTQQEKIVIGLLDHIHKLEKEHKRLKRKQTKSLKETA